MIFGSILGAGNFGVFGGPDAQKVFFAQHFCGCPLIERQMAV
jgi:hypothetical protein